MYLTFNISKYSFNDCLTILDHQCNCVSIWYHFILLVDGVDEDYMPYSKKAHTTFQRSPALVQECYTAQEVISDGLPSYSFRNRSEKRSKESLWSKDKDWSPDADMESSDASEE